MTLKQIHLTHVYRPQRLHLAKSIRTPTRRQTLEHFQNLKTYTLNVKKNLMPLTLKSLKCLMNRLQITLKMQETRKTSLLQILQMFLKALSSRSTKDSLISHLQNSIPSTRQSRQREIIWKWMSHNGSLDSCRLLRWLVKIL